MKTMAFKLRARSAEIMLLVGVLAAASPLSAQDYSLQTGSPTFTSSLPVEMGFVNLANGNLQQTIPIASAAQRGRMPFSASEIYDSRIWQIVNTGGALSWQPTNVPNSQGGWRFATTADPGAVTFLSVHEVCAANNVGWIQYYGFQWTRSDGTRLFFPVHTYKMDPNFPPPPSTCGNPFDTPSASASGSDSSGYLMSVTNYTQATILAHDGTQIFPRVEDTNGNFFSSDSSGNVIDTLGRTPVTKSVNGNTTTYTVLKSDGGQQNYTVTAQTINVATNFGVSGVTEYSGTLTVIQTIQLPDSTKYSFGYDSYGELNSVTLPTGATVTYGYSNFLDSVGGTNRWVSSRTSGGGTWNYAPLVVNQCATQSTSCVQQTTVSKPSGDNSVHSFTIDNGAWTGSVQFYTGAVSPANLQETVTSTWNLSNPCQTDGCTGNQDVQLSAETITRPVPGGSVNRTTQWTYVSINDMNPTKIQQWNYYTGTLPANPDVETDISYGACAQPVNLTVCPGSKPACTTSDALSQTLFAYDEAGFLVDSTPATGIVNHDDTNYGKGSNQTRCNLTHIQRWAGGSSFLSGSSTYDTTGQVVQVTDPNGVITKFSYTDNFFTDNGANPPAAFKPLAPTNAYVTQVTVPLVGVSNKYGYYFNTGRGASAVDQNGADGYTHYDSLDRLASQYMPPSVNGHRGWMLADYPSSTEIDTYTSITSSTASKSCTNCRHQQVNVDSLGRQTSDILVSDPDGATTVTTNYDSSGRIQSTTNPYRSTTDPTYGLETPTYDGLDRIISITHQDQSVSKEYYGAAVSSAGGLVSQQCPPTTCGLGYPTLTVDPSGKMRQTWSDGFGRIIEVDEPGDPFAGTAPSPGTLTIGGTLLGVNPATPSTGSVTINSGTGEQCYLTVCETGTLSISFNNGAEVDSVSYGSGDSTNTIAARLASAINNCGQSPCYATAGYSGATVNFTSTVTGAAANWQVNTSYYAPDATPSPSSAIWSSGTVQAPNSKTGAPGCMGIYLPAGQNLLLGQCLNSANGRFVLVLQNDGNLVLYDDTPDPNPWTVVWATGTFGRGVDHGYMQSDGNFVLYAGTTPIWWTGSHPTNAYYLIMQNDGNLVIYPGFPQPSFTIAPSQQTMSGGKDTVPGNGVYDSGTVTVVFASGFTASAPYSQSGNNTAALVAAALAGTGPTGLNRPGSPVQATVPGGTASINLIYAVGSAGNGSVTATSASNNPSLFPTGSFSGSTNLSGGQDPYSSGIAHPYVTYYIYNLLNNLTQVTQGQQTRTYSYDVLSRVTSKTTPEDGTTYSYYTAANGSLCSGNASLICRRKDARGITTTNSYDQLNRATSVSYSDGTTPSVSYFYDQISYSGLTIVNGKGRLTGMSDGSGSSAWSYDLLGQISTEQHVISGVNKGKSISYTYNLDGSLASLTYPSGRQVTYSYSNAQRALSATDTGTGAKYASGAQYAPQGNLAAFVLGQSATFAGITQTYSYNNRMQLNSQQASSATGPVLDFGFGYPGSPRNNGQLSSIANHLDSGRTVSATYDALHRIATAQTQGTSGPNCWGQSFGYDRWANLLSITVTQCTASPLSVTAANNQLAGFSYDLSGNMTGDGGNTYTYDAENRLTSAAGVNYVYDGRALRVKKSNGTLYWRGFRGDAFAESDLSGKITSEYIFFDGLRTARIDTGNAVFYYFTDQLGSTRAVTTSNGTVCYSADFTPYGGEVAIINTCAPKHKFTGYERDSEAGLDYAVYRQYSSRLARFLQPDPLAGSINNPQSLNRYAYALDDPLNWTDKLGLSPCPAGYHTPTADEAKAIVAAARSFLNKGITYTSNKNGGPTTYDKNGNITSIDCSHLVNLVVNMVSGYSVPWTPAQATHDGNASGLTPDSGPHVGDVIAFNGHVAIVTNASPVSFIGSQRKGPGLVDLGLGPGPKGSPGGQAMYWNARMEEADYFQICIKDKGKAPTPPPAAEPGPPSLLDQIPNTSSVLGLLMPPPPAPPTLATGSVTVTIYGVTSTAYVLRCDIPNVCTYVPLTPPPPSEGGGDEGGDGEDGWDDGGGDGDCGASGCDDPGPLVTQTRSPYGLIVTPVTLGLMLVLCVGRLHGRRK